MQLEQDQAGSLVLCRQDFKIDTKRVARCKLRDVVARTQVVLVIGCFTSDLDT